MKKIFLHLGAQKTGSTSIQLFLEENNELLKSQGYLYLSKNTSGDRCMRLSFLFNAQISKGYNAVESLAHEVEPIKKTIHQSPYQNFIISSENFLVKYTVDEIEQLLSLFHPYEIYPILYVRRQDRFFESLYKEAVSGAQRFCRTIDQFRTPFVFNYNQVISNFENFLPLDSIILRPFEKSQMPNGNVVEDFIQALGLDISNMKTEVQHNVSDCFEVNELLRVLNHIDIPADDKWKILPLLHYSARQFYQDKETLTNITMLDDADAFLRVYNESNQQLAWRKLKRRNLFFDPVSDNVQSAANIHLDGEKIKQDFLHYLQSMDLSNLETSHPRLDKDYHQTIDIYQLLPLIETLPFETLGNNVLYAENIRYP